MNRLFVTLLISILFTSCHMRQEVTKGPFEINKKVNCEDLFEQGYQWMPGVDVVLLGKRSGDTLDVYQIEYEVEDIEFYVDEFLEFDTSTQQVKSSKYIETPPEPMPEFSSGLTAIDLCEGGFPNWRNMEIDLPSYDSLEFLKSIDRDMFSVIVRKDDWYLFRADVINKSTLDTFDLSVFEKDGAYFMSSKISF